MTMMWTVEIQILNEDMIVALMVIAILQINPQKFFGTSTGCEPMASTLALQCSIIELWRPSRPICWVYLNPWKEWDMKIMRTAEIQILNEDMIAIIVIIAIYKMTKIVGAFWLVKNLWFIVPVNSIENVFYKSNRPHYLWVYQRDNPLWMLEEHSKSL